MNIETLNLYGDAWNRHDIDTIMELMTEDCVFESAAGSEKYGTRVEGAAAVRQRFIEVWTALPDVHFAAMASFVSGEHGCSEWTFTGTREDGEKIEADGCDLFTFENGKIKSKRSYFKNRS